jgi:hypothetical protein
LKGAQFWCVLCLILTPQPRRRPQFADHNLVQQVGETQDGETDPLRLAEMAKGKMRRKIPDLAQVDLEDHVVGDDDRGGITRTDGPEDRTHLRRCVRMGNRARIDPSSPARRRACSTKLQQQTRDPAIPYAGIRSRPGTNDAQ